MKATPTNETKTAAPSQAPKMTRTRSPAYPAMSLGISVEKAKTAWGHIKRNAVAPDSFASMWGLNPKSSQADLTVAALKKYGLLESPDKGDDRLLRLSDSAIQIILENEKSPERLALLKQAALTPKIHSELWRLWNGDLPSDLVIKQHLILKKNFNANSVDGFIKTFKETISFANLSPDDKIVKTAGEDAEDSEVEPVESVDAVRDYIEKRMSKPSIASQPANQVAVYSSTGTNTGAVIREFNFPLPGGTATIRVPFPLTEADFASLMNALNVFKEGMVRIETPILDCLNNDKWADQAVAIAKTKTDFSLANFSYSFNIEAAQKLASDHGFDVRFDFNKGMAYFKYRKPA